ncbi:MAG TPA: OmpA family protein [Gemmatimonadales bacterium]|nr:OmpA family protein [Gemmatimonadales bacterium]
MHTYHAFRTAVGAALLTLLGAAGLPAPAASQVISRPEYRFELSGAGTYARFNQVTNLGPGWGGTARLGFWLPLNFSVEAEGSYLHSTARSTAVTGGVTAGYGVTSLGGALLYNLPLGPRNFLFLKGGYNSTRYSSARCNEPVVPVGPCAAEGGAAKTGAVLGGAGLRLGLSDLVMARLEGTVSHSNLKNPTTVKGLTTASVSLGLSLMLGAGRPGDSDQDGVTDNLDRCPDTPAGALVDYRGCPVDSDRDGVADGIDRCPNTPAGARVDATGCPRDADQDGVPDQLDRCPDTPAGATVDARGCPRDSDDDGIVDGVDRCPDTPKGATVDAVGCPGDEDGDGVLDGLDRCPRTPPGRAVNAYGCLPGQGPGQPEPRDSARGGARDSSAAPPTPPASRARDTAAATREGGGGIILRGVTFASGSARLSGASRAVLDSVAAALKAQPTLMVEIGGHTDNSGPAAANQHLSLLRAEAVRSALMRRGIPGRRMVARGYGATVPLVPGDDAAARARNRRVEIKPLGTTP